MFNIFQEIPVLDHGFVRLDAALADDLSVANSARVSFNTKITQMDEADAGLVRFLMKNRHGTPFEHNLFRFHVKAPIFIAREWFRHRIGSFNEWSARYSQLEPEFYIPALADVRTQVGKPGAYSYVTMPEEQAQEFIFDLERESYRAYEFYLKAIRNGVAKELAREHLPVNIYTQWYWSVNARSLMNFLNLRNAETAQREIWRYAIVVEEIFKSQMPITAETFIANGRIAP